ncbi:hypothetical protein MUN46_011560 [Mesosutterella sp. AGMB02718]|uniref:Uncharacterized protein n=1 Tax=Mesosutterella faecium TaxID=2925194 RepID=A0ABT7IPM6_9BURK|nr:hypothetical protein [Mesosutterella sp. AGMB02718]MDL2060350.1 hypothetical protein [Mesosutterella sp. AGMB02718]MDL2060573.1 hypothetical protein [Mesosutterella sp. AGMB02718]
MDVEQRLRNWGRWSRTGSGSHAQASPIYRMMRENNPDYEVEPSARLFYDEQDAMRVDKAITNARLYPYEKEMLKMRYIQLCNRTFICRYERILYREFDTLMAIAVAKVKHELEFDV